MSRTVPKMHTEYDPPEDPGISDFGPSKTKQEFADESDINHILDQYEETGLIPMSDGRTPIYGDFSAPELQNYHQALNIVAGTQELMGRLPAKIRETFDNDPMKVLAFCENPDNRAKAIELGLIDKAPEPTPPAPPAPPAPVTK